MKNQEAELEAQGNNKINACKKYQIEIITQNELADILPFGKTKINQLIKAGQLPLVKIGKDYITTVKLLEEWIAKNIGEEIYY